jgi:hypothetical protein
LYSNVIDSHGFGSKFLTGYRIVQQHAS